MDALLLYGTVVTINQRMLIQSDKDRMTWWLSEVSCERISEHEYDHGIFHIYPESNVKPYAFSYRWNGDLLYV